MAVKKGKGKPKKQPKIAIPYFGRKGGHRKDNPNLTYELTPTSAGYVFGRYKSKSKDKDKYNVVELGGKRIKVNSSLEFESKRTLDLLKESGLILDYKERGRYIRFNEEYLKELGFDDFAKLLGNQDLGFNIYTADGLVIMRLEPKNMANIDYVDSGVYSISFDIKNLANKDDSPYLDAFLEFMVIPEKYRGQGKGLEILAKLVKGLKRISKDKGKEGVDLKLLADIQSGYWTWLRYGFKVSGNDKDVSKSDRGMLFTKFINAIGREFGDTRESIIKFINENIDYKSDFINEYFGEGKGIWLEFLITDLLQMKYGLSETEAISKYKNIFRHYQIDYVGSFKFLNNDTADNNYSIQMLEDVYYNKFGKELKI